jgi:hypothetical protein
VYVASSWRNPTYPAVIHALRAAGIDHYDFRNPPDGAAFNWAQIGGPAGGATVPQATYLTMLDHPAAKAGFAADMAALQRADVCVLVLPCGRSAHLELGWAAGAGKRTAVLLDDPTTPELMYRMVDHLSPTIPDLIRWLGADHI